MATPGVRSISMKGEAIDEDAFKTLLRAAVALNRS
jgi:hypothetical protein